MTSLCHDVITSRRSFGVESMALCLRHVWCEFGSNRARNTDTVALNRNYDVITSWRHIIATFYSGGIYGLISPSCLVWVWRQSDPKRGHSTPNRIFLPKNDVITSWRHNVVTYFLSGIYASRSPLCLVCVWRQLDQKYGHSSLKSQFLSKFRHFFANISRTAGPIFNP